MINQINGLQAGGQRRNDSSELKTVESGIEMGLYFLRLNFVDVVIILLIAP